LASSIARRSEVRRVDVPWWRLVAVAGTAMAFAALLLLLTHSGVFHVRTIEVDGAAHLDRTDVVRLSGVTDATNAVWLDEKTVEERLETDPWIRRARVSVTLPWTVHISLRERRPVAAVRQTSGLLAVAGDGTALGSASRSPGLPVIVMPPISAVEGALPSLTGPALALGALEPKLRARVVRVVVASSGLDLILDDGTRIDYGAADLFAPKARAIEDVLGWAETQGTEIRSIDVSAPTSPAVVPGT
jgi:cell division protein FtsQ